MQMGAGVQRHLLDSRLRGNDKAERGNDNTERGNDNAEVIL